MGHSTIADFYREEEQAYLSQRSSSLSDVPQNISQAEKWASMGIGGALVLAGLSRGRLSGLLAAVTGGALLYRGITGHCYAYEALGYDTAEHNESVGVPAQQGVKLEKSININRSPEELFSFWRNFENLPRIMQHLKEVKVITSQRSHWIAEGVGGKAVEWDAEIINERDGELIAWRSLAGGDIDTAGSVHFKSAANGRGTTVTVSMKYNPPGGKIAATVASWLGVGAEQKVVEDLRRFKQLMEAGEIAKSQNDSQLGQISSPSEL